MKDSDVVHISLDTDPNEDADRVKSHVASNGFDWYYAISPADVTKSLIAEFGVRIVNAPAVPMILICEDQSSRLLGRGVKSKETLNAEIAQGC